MWWSALPALALISSPALLLAWWWIRGLRTGVFVFPYVRVDRQRQRIEFWFWVIAAGIPCWLVIAAMLVWFVWATCCAPRFVLA
jgi:hypothetical protein